MHVAVVCRVDAEGKVIEKSNSGPWTSFMGTDRNETIERAIKQAEVSNGRNNPYAGSYVVVVGEVNLKVAKPVMYKLVPLKESIHGNI